MEPCIPTIGDPCKECRTLVGATFQSEPSDLVKGFYWHQGIDYTSRVIPITFIQNRDFKMPSPPKPTQRSYLLNVAYIYIYIHLDQTNRNRPDFSLVGFSNQSFLTTTFGLNYCIFMGDNF